MTAELDEVAHAPSWGRSSRLRPVRAGIINLWDYRDEEFVFADGRLVLRGPNGSGKTKALEVLFPFVLDGRIEPRRLNPFSSEDRTMRSNLLYRGQQSGYGYVWMEFGSALPGDAVTVGVGLQAGRHSDKVKRWYFVVDGRVGVDFSLLTADDRPLTRKQLIAEVGVAAVRDSPAEHRVAVDTRMFGLGRERYEQLVSLVLTLRRPQLAKDLDPVKLSDTLSGGLRPLDDHLLTEAARSFDDMEAVAQTLERLVRADEAAGAFLSAYTTYLRSHARTRADALTERRDAVAAGRTRVAAAQSRVRHAVQARDDAEARVREAGLAIARLRARLEQLKTSAAYQAHEQLADLRRVVGELNAAHTEAAERHAERTQALAEAREHLAVARDQVDRLAAEAGRVAATLAEDAADAGLHWGAVQTTEAGFADRAGAAITAREDDLRAVRGARDRFEHAERARRDAEVAADRAAVAVTTAEADEDTARSGVEQAREQVRQRLANWSDRHAATVTELSVPGLLDSLADAIEATGEPDATDPRTTFHRATADAVQTYRDEQARLREQRTAITAEIRELTARRQAVAAEQDDAPPRFAARAEDRAGRAGAPLWRLVRFAEHLTDDEAAGLEAALEAANLLDAWVAPEAGPEHGTDDGFLVPLPPGSRPDGVTLAAALVSERGCEVDPARVSAVLESIALLAAGEQPVIGGPPAVSVAGRFGQGVQLGGFGKPAAEYVGATARARRRAARLVELDEQISAASVRRDDVERLLTRTRTVLDAVAAADAELPRVAPIVEAVRRLDQAAGQLRATREAHDAARSVLDRAVAEVGVRDRALRATAAERALAPDRLEAVAAALSRFGRTADRLSGLRKEAGEARARAGQEAGRVDRARRDEDTAAQAARRAELRAAEESERLDTLHRAVGTDEDQVLAEVSAADTAIGVAADDENAARDAEKSAIEESARAESEVGAARDALRGALAEEQAEARQLEPFAEADVLRLLRCPGRLGWPARPEDWADPGAEAPLPDAVIALHEAVLAVTRDLRPTESSVKQSTTRLVKGLEELSGELSGAGHDYRPEWDSSGGIIVVRVADEHGLSPVGAFAQRIGDARRDQELLLTESERRVLEDALLTQLARQIHERTIEARDLIGRMNDEMRRRRMSSGLTVGVRWELADALADEQRGVVRLMERDAAALRPEELARIRAHFAAAIKTARAGAPERVYRELLAEVLDYRRWRAFSFYLHPPSGGPERLTKARHGQLSGGEQSVSLHLPLFAAAHAMLNSADPRCPRLLALDEAFAGVDDKGRTELFGLAAEFDFDLVMTGYDLWATYATVPAAAHYDLSHAPAEHTVSALLMLWDGTGTDADLDGGLAAALGSPLRRRRPGTGTGLLDNPDADDEFPDEPVRRPPPVPDREDRSAEQPDSGDPDD
jgi:uncharacterized protein (TIGR02680 family)